MPAFDRFLHCTRLISHHLLLDRHQRGISLGARLLQLTRNRREHERMQIGAGALDAMRNLPQ